MATKEEKEQAGKELDAARKAIRARQSGEKIDFESLRKREKELGDEYLKKMDAFFSLLES